MRLEDNARLSGAASCTCTSAAGAGTSRSATRDSFVVDQALDTGVALDMAELLAMIAQDHCASTPPRADGRGHEPAGVAREDPDRFPDGLLVANKTGASAATATTPPSSNAGRGAAGDGRFWKGLTREAKGRADAAIAAIAAVVYEHLGSGVNVAGARILVVGGAHRLGRALALDLAGHGSALAASSRTQGDAAGAQAAALRGGRAGRGGDHGDARLPAGAARLVADAREALVASTPSCTQPAARSCPRPHSRSTKPRGTFAGHDRQGLLLHGLRRHARLSPAGAIIAITDYLGVQPWASFAAHGVAEPPYTRPRQGACAGVGA